MPSLKKPPGNEFLERLIRLFLWAETSIINTLGGLRTRGLADYHVEAALGRVRGILQRLLEESREYAPQMVERQFYVRHPEKRKLPETVEKHRRAYQSAEALTIGQTAVAERLTENLLGEIAEASLTVESNVTQALRTMAIGRLEPDIFRQAGLSQVSALEALGKGPNSMVHEFVEALRREGVTAFVDKAGRHWSLHTYGAMVCRTTSRQAEVLSVLTADEEQDLYKISSHATTCPVCAPFEGRVYSRSGTDPDFPPLADAFGKIDKAGPNDLANTYLNIHPNCLHVLVPWTAAGKSPEEIEKIKRFSSPKTNPYSVDPRSQKQIERYRKKELARRHFLQSYDQWERYKLALGDQVPKTWQTFAKHKKANDEKYKAWVQKYRWERKRESFQGLLGAKTSTGVAVTGVSKHVVDRAVERKFTAETVLDALQNPVKIGKIRIDDKGSPSQQFTGESAAVVINPDTGNLISGWSKKK